MQLTKTELTYNQDSVNRFSNQIRKQKQQEAHKRQQERIRFATALEQKQQQQSSPSSNANPKSRISPAKQQEKDLWDRVEKSKEWQEYHTVAEQRRKKGK
jgi:hypothetical protein